MSRGRVLIPETGWASVSADASVPASREQPDSMPAGALAPKTRNRLFIKYVGLFVAMVCVALLANGIFEVFFYYQEYKAPRP